MNMQEVKELMLVFNDSTLREFDLRKGDFEMYFSKNESYGRTPTVQGAAYPQTQSLTAEEISLSQNITTSSEAEKESTQIKAAEGEIVTSPIVGNVYLQPAPDKPAYVKVGDFVSTEDTICIVEAMKMMNEVPAGMSGVVTEVIVTNEQVVGIGDALIRIKPN